MDLNFLGIGIPEILVILIIALIVVGPQRLPEVAAQIGRAVRQIRRYAAEITYQFREELDALTREYEAMQEELKRTQEELRQVQEQIREDARAVAQDLESAQRDIAEAVDTAAVAATKGQGESAKAVPLEVRRDARGEEEDRLPTSS